MIIGAAGRPNKQLIQHDLRQNKNMYKIINRKANGCDTMLNVEKSTISQIDLVALNVSKFKLLYFYAYLKFIKFDFCHLL